MPRATPIRVLVADDDDGFAAFVTELLERESDLEVVGRAADGDEAVRLAADLRPDVVLMDIQMPRTGGVEATRRIAEEVPGTQVLVVTAWQEAAEVEAALAFGARDRIEKDEVEAELVPAIRRAAGGG